MNLGENIYRLRTEKNMSQVDLAEALDVSRQSVSKWENNSAVPELSKLMKMSELFGVSLDELAGKEKPQAPEPVVQTVYVKSSMPGRKIAGIILLCGAFLAFLLMAVFADPLTGLFMAVPLAAFGTLCLVCKHNPGYWCAFLVYWLVWLRIAMSGPVGIQTMGGIVTIALAVYGIILLARTLGSLCTGALRLRKGYLIAIAALLAVSVVIRVIHLFPA